MDRNLELQEFVEGLEMTVLRDEDSILMDGMVGTSGANNLCNTDTNCGKTGCGGTTVNNCQGGNCTPGCGTSTKG